MANLQISSRNCYEQNYHLQVPFIYLFSHVAKSAIFVLQSNNTSTNISGQQELNNLKKHRDKVKKRAELIRTQEDLTKWHRHREKAKLRKHNSGKKIKYGIPL